MATIPSFNAFKNKPTISLLRTRKILGDNENVVNLFERVVTALVDIEEIFNTSESEKQSLKADLLNACDQKIIAFGSPILLNAGLENRSLSSCTIIPINLREDFESMKKSIFPYYEKGMGSGFNLNEVDDPIQTLKQLNQILIEITPLIDRPACGMAMLDIDHPKIEEFILLKKNEDFYKWRFNISIGITKNFLDSVKNNVLFTLKDGSQISAEKLLLTITDTAHFCGEPGMVFLDRIAQENPVPSIECKTVVPCAEVALSEGEVCQFSYLNISKIVKITDEGKTFDFPSLERHTKLLTRILDNAIEISSENAVSNHEVIKNKRRIAIGICGAADLFLDLGLPYISKQAQELLSNIMATINICSKEMSVELAKKRTPFPLFNMSLYLKKGFASRFKKTISIIPTSRWESLEQSILRSGIRNTGTTALPPTGLSAIIVDVSPSIEPRLSLNDNQGKIIPLLFSHLQIHWDKIQLGEDERNSLLRRINLLGYIPNDMKKISQKIKQLFLVSKQVHWMSQLKMTSAVQKFNDESISKTVNCPKETTPEEIHEIFLQSNYLELKGITVFRDQCLEERIIPSDTSYES